MWRFEVAHLLSLYVKFGFESKLLVLYFIRPLSSSVSTAWESHRVKPIMENGKGVTDPGDVVRKLQEKVRELELQLIQKSGDSRNGVSAPSSQRDGDDLHEDLVPVDGLDFCSKTWLVRSAVGQADPRPDQEVFDEARRRAGVAQYAALYAAVCNAEQDRRRNIDSRTFTRPKKRMGRPSLELLESLSSLSKPTVSQNLWASGSNEMAIDNLTCSLLESSMMNYGMDTSQTNDITSQLSIVNKKQKVSSQTERRRGSLVLSEVNDDASDDLVLTPKIDNGNTMTAYVENVNYSNFKVSSQQNDVPSNMEMNSTMLESSDFSTSLIDSALLDANLMDTIIVNTKPKLSAPKMHQLNRTFTPSPPPAPKGCDQGQHQSANETLNNTFVKEEESPNCPLLNNTFSLDGNESSGSQRNVPSLRRPGSTDSGGADDDQLSSASESSHTSSTRLMSVGDVQHIARLQEQSLVISTPVHRHLAKVLDYADDISPILRSNGPDCGRSSGSSEIQTGGYLSDHSSRSPMSSLHSSPAGSPFGSSTMLPGSNLAQVQDSRLSYRPNGMLQRKNTYGLIPSAKAKERGLRLPAPSAVPSLPKPAVRSGLRPPMIRSNIPAPGSSGLPRPAATGIPRPAPLSRIPPPKVRSSVPRPSRKEWTDECF